MAITNDKLMKKMIHELYEAKENQHSDKKMASHIANVRLLCDLFLEDDHQVEEETEFSKEEIKAMIGEQSGNKGSLQGQTADPVTDDEANGKSIFDF
ncbi:YwdI family protein [Oceanobacillus saliphilus]|uniref:YwdI family protein n=1 Tax=Oceanobacillus saliphilus TaxID=2925834 RepID=UPI00201E53D3|nr:YwdI family protein [Oceanobacillus saliphilus]